MPRDSSGNYILPDSNPVKTGTIIASEWANETMPDLAEEMQDSLSRTGRGGMLAPLKLPNGTQGAPSYTFTTNQQLGWYLAQNNEIRFTINNVDIIRIVPNGIEAWNPIDMRWYPIINSKTSGGSIETQTLEDAQTVVAFTANVAGAGIYYNAADGSRGRILEEDDYTYDAVTNEITLTTPAAVGDKITASYNDDSEVAAAVKAARDLWLHFNDIYYGASATEPTEAPSGAPSTEGDLYFNTTDNLVYVYNGTVWLPAYRDPTTVVEDQALLAAGQTTATFNFIEADRASFFLIGLNVDQGRLQAGTDYNVINKTTVELVESYPEGTILLGAQTDPVGQSPIGVESFDTVAVLKQKALPIGALVKTKGYYTIGDGGGATYLVAASQAVDGVRDHVLANGNVSILQGGASRTLIVDADDDAAADLPALRVRFQSRPNTDIWLNPDAQNFFFSDGGKNLTNGASGSKDGNNNTAIGFGNMLSSTSSYACTAVGFNSLNSQTTGDSNTAVGYQSLSKLTDGKNNTAVGTDAGFNITTGSNNVAIGRHVLFDAATAGFTGSGNTMVGTDVQLSAVDTLDCVIIGFNASLNAVGGTTSNIIGKAAARDCLNPDQSQIIGATAAQAVGVLFESVTIGDRALQNSASDTSSVNIGADVFFTSAGSQQVNQFNVGLGSQCAFQTWGTNNTLIGYRAGANAALTELNNAVLIGYRAGDNHAVDGDFEINNNQNLSNALLNGNFTDRTLVLEASKLSFKNIPTVGTGASGTVWNDNGTLKIVP